MLIDEKGITIKLSAMPLTFTWSCGPPRLQRIGLANGSSVDRNSLVHKEYVFKSSTENSGQIMTSTMMVTDSNMMEPAQPAPN